MEFRSQKLDYFTNYDVFALYAFKQEFLVLWGLFRISYLYNIEKVIRVNFL